MAGIWGNTTGPTQLNKVRINQSVLGFPVAVIMGCGKIQQSLLWIDGFNSSSISGQTNGSGGKGFGGGKDGNEFDYSADVIAALCAGPIVAVGDVWSGNSWLRNTTAVEIYVLAGATPSYTVSNASNFAADMGVGFSMSVAGTYNDLGAESPTVITGNALVPAKNVPYGSTLASGEYSFDAATNTYYFSAADVGLSAYVNYSFSLASVTKQENGIIPSGLQISVGTSTTGDDATPFAADGGVTYYSTGLGQQSNVGQALQRVSGTPTVTGTYSVSGTTPAVYQFAPGDVNQEVQITYVLDETKTLLQGTPQSLDFMTLNGVPGQSPWSLLETNYPGAALGYTGIALVAFGPMDLGVSGEIQENNYEVLTPDAWGSGILDCNPVQNIMQVLTNPMWGLGAGVVPFPVAVIDCEAGGTWGSGGASGATATAQLIRTKRPIPISPFLPINESTATAWFAANNFFISPVIDKQETAASVMGRWLEAGMCSAFMSEGLMKLVPYGDTTVSANGATWVAPNEYAAQLDDTDFIQTGKNEDPVKLPSSDWTEAFNTVQVSWSNRGNQYAPEVTPESDQAAINRYGSRIEDPQSWEFITTLAAATFAASMRVKRSVYIRNQYTFKLPYKHDYLEPMDIVEIATASSWAVDMNPLGIVNLPVRITKIVDNPDGTLDITAEDYPYGTNTATIFNKFTSAATPLPNQFTDPGNTAAVLFEAPNRLTGYKGNQIWIGAAGENSAWGGCNVLASMDGDTYLRIGTISVPARLGTLSTAFPAGSDPDTADTLVVDLIPGSNPLESASQADADQGNTLCALLDGTLMEIISYSACAITGPEQFTMGTYIRRGQMGTTPQAFTTPASTDFLRLDNAVFKYTYDPSWYGKTVYLKFQSFNVYGNAAQDPSTLTPVTFVVPGQNGGAFSAATGAAGNLGGIPATTIVQGLVNTGALSGGTYGGTTYASVTVAPAQTFLSSDPVTSVTLTATITGTSETAVTWSCSGSPNGSGSVSQSGVWTPPPESSSGSATITCALTSNPEVYGTAVINW